MIFFFKTFIKTNVIFKLDVQFLIHTYVFQTSLTEQKDYKVFNVLHKYSVHFWHNVLSSWILIWYDVIFLMLFETYLFEYVLRLLLEGRLIFYMTKHFSFEQHICALPLPSNKINLNFLLTDKFMIKNILNIDTHNYTLNFWFDNSYIVTSTKTAFVFWLHVIRNNDNRVTQIKIRHFKLL